MGMTELSAEFLSWADKQKIKEAIQEVRARPTHLHSIIKCKQCLEPKSASNFTVVNNTYEGKAETAAQFYYLKTCKKCMNYNNRIKLRQKMRANKLHPNSEYARRLNI